MSPRAAAEFECQTFLMACGAIGLHPSGVVDLEVRFGGDNCERAVRCEFLPWHSGPPAVFCNWSLREGGKMVDEKGNYEWDANGHFRPDDLASKVKAWMSECLWWVAGQNFLNAPTVSWDEIL